MYHLLIVDDEKNFADGFATWLEGEGYQVSVVYDGKGAIPKMQMNPRIDLVLLDINLNDPLLNGRDVFRQIKQLPQSPLVIMLTAQDSIDAQVDGLRYADDYLPKSLDQKLWLARIEKALRTRDEGKKNQLVIDQHLRLDLEKRRVYRADEMISLTPREYDLLSYLASHPGRPFGRQQLLDAVWGIDYEGQERTVDKHIVSLRQKVEMNPNDPQYILTVHKFGYQFRDR